MGLIEAQSSKWDCDVSLKELIEYNEGKCLIDRNTKRSHTYQGPVVYFKYPGKDKFSIQVALLSDGFYYRADREATEDEFVLVDAKEGLKELLEYNKGDLHLYMSEKGPEQTWE